MVWNFGIINVYHHGPQCGCKTNEYYHRARSINVQCKRNKQQTLLHRFSLPFSSSYSCPFELFPLPPTIFDTFSNSRPLIDDLCEWLAPALDDPTPRG